ncbi:glycosyltransferase family 2 protein [Soonwooa sp.]|uniref:glycosyltransferase family 2 protein n=1 Tax=Soonwooa sp. TaxID=1938592 RepID=UPI0035B1505B
MQNTNPKVVVSICSITFNHAPYIRKCLDGFLMQECDFEFEVLIHDDASTDGTAEIIKEYQQRYPDIIKPILQTKNQWSQGIRNIQSRYNFSRAKGKYIAMCEGDDYWTDPHKLQKQVDFLEANEEFVLTSHKRILVDKSSNEIINLSISKNDYHTQCLLFKNILKEDYLKNNSNIFNGDTFLIIYLSNFGKSKILDFVGAAYRIVETGVWSTIGSQDRAEKTEESYKDMRIFFSKYKYFRSLNQLDKYELDSEIILFKKRKDNTFFDYLKLLIRAVACRDLNRIKSVIKLKF